jgi:hypothetical protein
MNDLPNNAKILIPHDPHNYPNGLDGGAWIGFVTGREIKTMKYDLDFSTNLTLREICAVDAEYIYIGNKPYSFSFDSVKQRIYWYVPFISFSDVKLYKVIGCSQNDQVVIYKQ